jgi:hypothetical protein
MISGLFLQAGLMFQQLPSGDFEKSSSLIHWIPLAIKLIAGMLEPLDIKITHFGSA